MACSWPSDRALTLVHPYDDLQVAAGQGTLALEMLAAAAGRSTPCWSPSAAAG